MSGGKGNEGDKVGFTKRKEIMKVFSCVDMFLPVHVSLFVVLRNASGVKDG